MPLNQASLLYHILRGVACRLCDKPKVGKRFIDTTVDLVWAKCGNGIGWTRRIPAAEWRNRGGGRGEAEGPAEAEKVAAAAEKSASAAEKVAGEEKCWEWGRFPLGAVRVSRDG